MLRKWSIPVTAAVLALLLPIASTTAQNDSRIYNGADGGVTRCPASDSGCTIYNAPDRMRDRINEGRRDVDEADNPLDKVKEVYKTLRDCEQCGVDALKNGTATH